MVIYGLSMSISTSIFDVIGGCAAFCVLVSYYATSFWLLRIAAIMSNILFVNYAIPQRLWPIAVLHCLLLPLNVWRLIPLVAERRSSGRAGHDDHEPAPTRPGVASDTNGETGMAERTIWERHPVPVPAAQGWSSYLGYAIFALGMLMLTVMALLSRSAKPNPDVCEFTQTGDIAFCGPLDEQPR
jgi:hypothetical protein